jgi:pyruvate dehydrogenase E2 component (dihydrolipoamide acetyltransferase)
VKLQSMPTQCIQVPNIGDSHDVDVVEVLVKPGDHVTVEQTLIVLESEKASMDVPASASGVVRELLIRVGDKASEGTPILMLESQDAVGGQSGDAGGAKAPHATSPQAAPAAVVETPPAGVSQPVAADRQAPVVQRDGSTEQPRGAPPGRTAELLPYGSPAVRRYSRELGVNLSLVRGSARNGRITKLDVQRYVKESLARPAGLPGAGDDADVQEIDFEQFGPVTREPLTKIQRLTGRNLHRSWNTIPHVTQFDEADITELEAFRKQLGSGGQGTKLTLLPFFIRAVVHVLKQQPRFNASLDARGENLVIKGYFHIGVAVDTPAGLVVPVIRDADSKSLTSLAQELAELSERARARRLSPSEMRGASMTISSLGGIGGTAFTPIINPPEVAILGVSRARLTPVYQVNGTLEPRLMCPLSLSYDHRVIDGADAARFTSKLATALGDIRRLLL